MEKFTNVAKRVAVAGVAGLASVPAMAVVDYTALTTAANFGDATTAVLAVAAALAGVYVVIKGIGLVLGMMKR